jgi:poly(ADP-ribose) glycohydrolase
LFSNFFGNTVQDLHNKDDFSSINSSEYVGVSTGNWGCGAFGGNPEIKSMIQWIAASQVEEKPLLI